MTQPSHYSEARRHLDLARNAHRGWRGLLSALIGIGYAVLHVADAMYDVLGELADLRAAREPSMLSDLTAEEILSEPVGAEWADGLPWSQPEDEDGEDLDETVPRPVYRHPLEHVDTAAVPDHAIADPRWLNLLRDDV